MSKYLAGTFVFDEPPCFCKSTKYWAWGTYENMEKKTIGLWIQCPSCKAKAHVSQKNWRCDVKFKENKKFEQVGECKIIPFPKKKK